MIMGPAAAAKLLSDYVDIEAPPRTVLNILTEITINEGWAEGADADELAARWERSFLRYVTETLRLDGSFGWVQPFCFNSYSASHLQGTCFCEPSDDQQVISAKKNRSNTYRIFQFIKSLNYNQIEKLCGRILTLFGVSDPHVSSQSNDGGVDFYGFSPFGSILREEILAHGVEKQLKIWFVGQSKHYPNGSISTNEIRELVGSTDLARAKIFAGKKDALVHLKARLCDPIFSMLVTTGRFSRDSKELLARAGIIAMDGPLIGQLLADHGIGIRDGQFFEQEVENWIDGNLIVPPE